MTFDTTNWPDLIEDVWALVVTNLQPRHKAHFRQTCRRFKTVVDITVQSIKVDPSGPGQVSSWNFCTQFPFSTNLDVSKAAPHDKLNDSAFAMLMLKQVSSLKLLTSMNLENCGQLSVAGAAAMVLA
ncbi:hypothetical protein CEUSTIGMA_g12944.t1 [Chlamydomonas eustigma]|uniref:F-box domain-containing protein n=1 Tax=Chlamydomonas eustigma TaxID=1157962 RepID=A0A250XR47_9CHLO|nr:hypothetical protein CEUSTIGMA_g12944.t1 [Chlamydomonas eustigma]|eukprot:GAX85528.1 hypothetical protein CEUSTIGMA_g12944.t1 [Chlamydomonas eustigma]